jgi:CDP-glucose 4,6-dehydratase
MAGFKQTFRDKKVIVTGHTGFKGSWLTSWLKLLGAQVTGIALAPCTKPSCFEVGLVSDGIRDLREDVRDKDAVRDVVQSTQPDFVFHLAAQSLVRESVLNPIETWTVNVMGTLNILNALRELKKPCTAVIITSDKCYENREWVWGYRETDRLSGIDPYSASKAAAELLIASHVKTYFCDGAYPVRIASVRAGNVIGGGDWAEHRIVPDCIRAWSNEQLVNLRNPNSTRPWQHVLEPLSGYLSLASEMSNRSDLHGESFNFGPSPHENYSVLALVREMSRYWNKVRWNVDENAQGNTHESALLSLNCDKANKVLGWFPTLEFRDAVRITCDWYKGYYEDSSDMSSLSISQINYFEDVAANKGIKWAQ